MRAFDIHNIKIAVEDRGSGKPVLLVHGFPLCRSMWKSQVESLVAAGYRAINPDLRGYGDSTLGEDDGEQGVDMHRYADDLAVLLDAMQVDEPVVFVGFSMGGYIAWEFVQRHRNKLAALVLCDTKAAADSEEAAVNRLKMAKLVDTWGANHVADLLIPKLFAAATIRDRPQLVEPVRKVIEQTPTAAIAAAQRGMARRADFTSRLSEFDLPILAIGGEHDAISPPQEMQSIADGLPNARFVEISGAGHMAPVENPDDVSEAIVEFLGQL
jgi:3-oxoadipate enol-lactonase